MTKVESNTKIFKECRNNGFLNPRIVGEKIVWSQMVQSYLSPPGEPIAVEEVIDDGFYDDIPF